MAGKLSTRRLRTAVLIDVLLTAVVVTVTAWALDWGARVSAQSVVARDIQRSEHLARRPDVNVRGAFFLPQVLTGRYGEVAVTLQGLRTPQLRLAVVTARLDGVHLALHDVVAGDTSTLFVEHSHISAQISYSAVNDYLARHDTPVTVSAGPHGELKVTGHFSVFGQSLAISADAAVRVRHRHIQLVPTRLDTGTPLDAASHLLLDHRLSITLPIPPLPFGQHVTTARAAAKAITVQAVGKDVVLTPLPPGTTAASQLVPAPLP